MPKKNGNVAKKWRRTWLPPLRWPAPGSVDAWASPLTRRFSAVRNNEPNCSCKTNQKGRINHQKLCKNNKEKEKERKRNDKRAQRIGHLGDNETGALHTHTRRCVTRCDRLWLCVCVCVCVCVYLSAIGSMMASSVRVGNEGSLPRRADSPAPDWSAAADSISKEVVPGRMAPSTLSSAASIRSTCWSTLNQQLSRTEFCWEMSFFSFFVLSLVRFASSGPSQSMAPFSFLFFRFVLLLFGPRVSFFISLFFFSMVFVWKRPSSLSLSLSLWNELVTWMNWLAVNYEAVGLRWRHTPKRSATPASHWSGVLERPPTKPRPPPTHLRGLQIFF